MAHLGNTIINGALRVIGGENVDTINGVTVGSSPKFTDASVSASSNHYTPATASGQDKSASASGATAAWSIDVVKGVTLNTDGKGHVTGISVTSGKIPANPNTNTTYTFATGDANGQFKVTPSSGSAYNVSIKGLGSAAYTAVGTGVVEVGRGSSRSTASTGTWTAMCRSDQTGSPVCPTSAKWWNIISMDNWGSAPNNWTSQLAVATQDDVTKGVWWRCNDSGGTSINSSTWHKLADEGGYYFDFTLNTDTNNKWYQALKVSTTSLVSFKGIMHVQNTSYHYSNGKSKIFLVEYSYTSLNIYPISCDDNYVTWLPTWRIATDSTYSYLEFLAPTLQSGYANPFRISFTPLTSSYEFTVPTTLTGTVATAETYQRTLNETFRAARYDEGVLNIGDTKMQFCVSGTYSSDYSALSIRGTTAINGGYKTNFEVSPYLAYFFANYESPIGTVQTSMYWFSGNGNCGYHNANDMAGNGVWYYNANGPAHGFQSTDGGLYAQFHSASWGGQIAQDYRDGDLCVRGKNNGTWTAWRPIPAGLTYSNGDINSTHSRNCNDWANSSGFFYFLSGGPDSISGWKAPDASGTGFTHNYSSNSWANQWAQDFYDSGAMYVRSNTGGTWGAWQRLIDSSQIGTARIDRTGGDAVWLQIKLNYGNDCINTGMFTFKVSLYDSYVMRIYQVSGYCYGGNHWYSPRVVKLAQAGGYGDSQSAYDQVYFRYDSNYNLYVYFYQGSYSGALISDVCNGFNHITNLNRVFNLSYVSSVGNTAQASANLFGKGNFDVLNGSSFLYKSLTPSAAGTCSLYCYGGIKMLTIWGTTWAATSGGAREVMSITDSNFKPITNIEIFGHDDNGAAVFGYITNTGSICIANRNAVPVYITATYM